MRIGLGVVGFCLVLSIAIAVVLKQRYGPEWAATQDVFLGLCYFMEANDGRMPASEAEFVASPFVQRTERGLQIKPPANTRFNDKVHGTPIESLASFKIAWGTDLSKVTFDDRGVAYDADHKTVELLSWPSSPPSGKAYTAMLMEARSRLK